jgi:hypothetical protein
VNSYRIMLLSDTIESKKPYKEFQGSLDCILLLKILPFTHLVQKSWPLPSSLVRLYAYFILIFCRGTASAGAAGTTAAGLLGTASVAGGTATASGPLGTGSAAKGTATASGPLGSATVGPSGTTLAGPLGTAVIPNSKGM